MGWICEKSPNQQSRHNHKAGEPLNKLILMRGKERRKTENPLKPEGKEERIEN